MLNIKGIFLKGERVTLECKKAQRSIPNSVWDTYSAFANTYGGTILLGVAENIEERDKSKRFEIVGVNDADKIRKDLWNTLNSKEKVSVNLLRDKDVQVLNIDGRDIIVINVPLQMPICVPYISTTTFQEEHSSETTRETIIAQNKS